MREKARKKRARIDARAHTRARAVRAWKKFFFPFPIYVFHILIYSLTLTNLRQAALRFPIAPNANHPSPPPNRMFLREFVKKKFVNLQNCFDLFIHASTLSRFYYQLLLIFVLPRDARYSLRIVRIVFLFYLAIEKARHYQSTSVCKSCYIFVCTTPLFVTSKFKNESINDS